MGGALTVPFAVAAVVLCWAGAAKLRKPEPAVRAIAAAGFAAASPALVRAVATGEVALGLWCALRPGRLAALLLGCVYVAFCCLSLALAARSVDCGCFGERDAPASGAQPLVSGVLASVALAAVAWSVHGPEWVIDRSVPSALVLALAIGAGAYATVLVYTELPALWGSWSGT